MYSLFSSYTQEIRNCWTAFTRLIYPTGCILCERTLDIDEKYLCKPCLERITTLKNPLCPKCAMELPPFRIRSSRCPSCRSMKTYFNRGTAVFPYRDDIKTILHQVKFEKKSWHLKALGSHLNRTNLPIPIDQYDLLVPVPIDTNRKREREFNQSDLIAHFLTKGKKAPPVRSILKKVKRTPPQSTLDRSERLNNLKNVFQLKRGVRTHNKTILLIDDIVTTGTTVNECAKCLVEHGARRVDFFCLARTISV